MSSRATFCPAVQAREFFPQGLSPSLNLRRLRHDQRSRPFKHNQTDPHTKARERFFVLLYFCFRGNSRAGEGARDGLEATGL